MKSVCSESAGSGVLTWCVNWSHEGRVCSESAGCGELTWCVNWSHEGRVCSGSVGGVVPITWCTTVRCSRHAHRSRRDSRTLKYDNRISYHLSITNNYIYLNETEDVKKSVLK